jgi:surface antigen
MRVIVRCRVLHAIGAVAGWQPILEIRDQKQWRELWVARNWTKYGRSANGPAPGVIAVYARGTGGHVGIVTSVPRRGVVVLKSGNDDGAVRERERSTKGVIAWRNPA